MKKLVITGTGIKAPNHLTTEARKWISQSDIVLHAIADPISLRILQNMNTNLESLNTFYKEGRPLSSTYELMVERILTILEEYDVVCVAMYGHPGKFVYSSHKAIQIAKERGYFAKMLPGISAFDCMVADLGFDPSKNGCLMIEATDLLVHNRVINVTFDVVIWQVGFIGELSYQMGGNHRSRIDILKEYLLQYYPEGHIVKFYVSSQIPFGNPKILEVPIIQIDADIPPTVSTLFVPALDQKKVDQYYFNKFNFNKKDLSPWRNQKHH